jgi:hypothetical protein
VRPLAVLWLALQPPLWDEFIRFWAILLHVAQHRDGHKDAGLQEQMVIFVNKLYIVSLLYVYGYQRESCVEMVCVLDVSHPNLCRTSAPPSKCLDLISK